MPRLSFTPSKPGFDVARSKSIRVFHCGDIFYNFNFKRYQFGPAVSTGAGWISISAGRRLLSAVFVAARLEEVTSARP